MQLLFPCLESLPTVEEVPEQPHHQQPGIAPDWWVSSRSSTTASAGRALVYGLCTWLCQLGCSKQGMRVFMNLGAW